jgi:apolipoprotein D and lipocalin family protein
VRQAVRLFAWLMVPLALAAQAAPPPTVPSVDLVRYAGTYYEIARFPNRFQKQCQGDVTARYTLRTDGRVDVVNRCRLADGTVNEARGIVRKQKGDDSGARLEVRFAPAFLSWLPQVWGDYWVLGLGPGYSFSVVGSPDREYLWILSRTPAMSEPAYHEALEMATRAGYDLTRLVRTRQGS